MNGLEQINSLLGANQTTKPNQTAQSPEALQKAAKQFEAILLMQLTSALNGSNDDNDEDSLFGSDGGSSLAKQMFSEQMATTMSDSGGVGLSDMIMQQFGPGGSGAAKNSSGLGSLNGLNGTMKMMSALKDIRDNTSSIKPLRQSPQLQQSVPRNLSANSNLINRSGRVSPLPTEAFLSDPNDAAVVSTFEDQLTGQPKDTTAGPLFPEEKIYGATRARRVNPAAAAISTESTARVNSLSTEASGPVSFNFPVRGRISSGFGTRFHPIDKVMKFHAGLDIAVPKGTRVDAAAEGVVEFVGQKGGYGNVVIIRHPDGKETRYGHLEKVLVNQGETVSSRQQIALSGSTGKSTGPHLHFEIRENGQVLNPLKFLTNVLPKSADR
jgi:murein DD-endopeptidase MepM/ murein hydrolase activator NlpD